MSETSERTPMDWDQRFKDNTTPWERGVLHPAFLDWRESGAFDDRERIIVPGCGRSPELKAFAALGKQVIGADLSGTALAAQKAMLDGDGLQAELIEADILLWRPDTPLDGIYEQTFLCAISPRLRQEYEQAVHAWLKPGGKLFALFMQKNEPGGPPYGCPLEAMRELFPDDRWEWPDGDPVPYPHPLLDDKAELAIILTRR
ncbi:methyltransferase domain-containing protein [Hyphobacterium sp. HN65]|uniref:Methyltransferase domain-containing protein n=1 Tax=Hyphobacterium lacteum TaxID=3116575 RepID=A0ABU7LMK6_9PROT|nr:methyltransferase domain-containing protein [Hyphobacterium sp. HN65]MEE2524851.1 methyltransferase domain-containing protein [Hyphobacterium sp. HN65]